MRQHLSHISILLWSYSYDRFIIIGTISATILHIIQAVGHVEYWNDLFNAAPCNKTHVGRAVSSRIVSILHRWPLDDAVFSVCEYQNWGGEAWTLPHTYTVIYLGNLFPLFLEVKPHHDWKPHLKGAHSRGCTKFKAMSLLWSFGTTSVIRLANKVRDYCMSRVIDPA